MSHVRFRQPIFLNRNLVPYSNSSGYGSSDMEGVIRTPVMANRPAAVVRNNAVARARRRRERNPFVLPVRLPGRQPTVGTPTQPRRQNVRRIGAATSKSAGFLSTRRRVRRRRSKRVTRSDITKWGSYKTMETGNVLSSDEVRYIGHSTFVFTQLWERLAAAMVKRLALKAGLMIQKLSDIIPYGIAGDVWTIRYRTSWESAAPLTDHNYTATGAYDYQDIIDSWTTFFMNFWNTQYNIDSIFFQPTTTAATVGRSWVQINLKNASIHVDCKATLKIQNRTINAEGDDNRDDVDNVPIYGKGYFGYGSGTQYNSGTVGTLPFVADGQSGIISKDALTDIALYEPPMAHLFHHCKSTGKVRLDPGYIKTSVLTWKRTVSLLSFMRRAASPPATNLHQFNTLGNFRFFGLEKMIDATPEGGTPIIVAFEHNYLCGMALQPMNSTHTSAQFQKLV